MHANKHEENLTQSRKDAKVKRESGIAAKRPAVVRQTPDYGGQAAKSTKKGINLTQRRKG
jgi:hypothetical protein